MVITARQSKHDTLVEHLHLHPHELGLTGVVSSCTNWFMFRDKQMVGEVDIRYLLVTMGHIS